ncbi:MULTISPECIES: EAL domain-containing protein [unclassified Thioalkalivibrio]|uniref:EAL domain-containing protein n=1 Tax=unclassified Thioalkalivibrio TaxID=2621013 RepID=UPI00036BA09A|nr:MULTISPECIES: EAL domain-containing protein [unclassified Thioalkalivibrio]
MVNGPLIAALYLLAGLCVYATASHLLHAAHSLRRVEHLLFAAMCLLMTGAAISIALTYQATSIEAYAGPIKVYYALIAPLYVLFAAFIARYTETPARGLLAVLGVLMLAVWIANTRQPYGLQLSEISELRTVAMPWGETLSLGMGPPSPWFLLALAGLLLVFGFALWALLRQWRREGGSGPLILFAAIIVFLAATVQGALVRLGITESVPLGVFGYLGMILVMSLVLHRETQERIRESEHRFRDLVHQAPMAVEVLTPEGRVRQVNAAWEAMHGRKGKRVQDSSVLHLPDTIDGRITDAIRAAALGERQLVGPFAYHASSDPAAKQAGNHWLKGCVYPLKNHRDEVQDIVVMQEDITLARRSEEALRVIAQGFRADNRQSFFENLVLRLREVFRADYALAGVNVPDTPGHIETAALCQDGELVDNIRYALASTPCDEVLSRGMCVYPDRVQELFPHDHLLGEMGARSYLGTPMLDSQGRELGHIAIINRYPLDETEQAAGILEIFADRAAAELERLEGEEHIRQLAYHDPLTGLANRTQLHDALTRDLERAQHGDQQGGLILIDLDHFKTINDALGHAVGDTVLAAVADRLRQNAPAQALVVRLGGDEFATLIHPRRASRQAIEATVNDAAQRLLDALQHPIVVGERTFSVGASLGCVLFPDAGQTSSDALRHADIALYQAKRAGRGGVQFYRHALQDEARARLQIEEGLRQALANHEMHLSYQPQFDAQENMIGAEALLRWTHPELGSVGPALFIPIAEETGLIHPIGTWVVEHVLENLRDWRARGLPLPPHVAINISPWQLARPDFVEQLRERVQAADLEPSRITLEVTESGLLRDLSDAIGKLRVLREFGVQVALDDFGTGYSSLAYLRDLPLDELKIDKSFIDELVDKGEQMLIENILDIGHNMGLRVIAEGVAQQTQRQRLLALGCTHFQGFLYGQPIAEDEFPAWLERNSSPAAQRQS